MNASPSCQIRQLSQSCIGHDRRSVQACQQLNTHISDVAATYDSIKRGVASLERAEVLLRSLSVSAPCSPNHHERTRKTDSSATTHVHTSHAIAAKMYLECVASMTFDCDKVNHDALLSVERRADELLNQVGVQRDITK